MLRAAKNQLIGLLSLLLLSACGPSPSLTDSDRDHDRSTATLNASGFDAERMQELTRRLQAGEFPNIHAVLVEQDARRVYEVYLAGQDQSWGVDVGFRRFDAWSLHDVRSVSKSVTSLLLGAALGDATQQPGTLEQGPIGQARLNPHPRRLTTPKGEFKNGREEA